MIMSVRASSLAAVELEVSLDGKKVASLYLLTEIHQSCHDDLHCYLHQWLLALASCRTQATAPCVMPRLSPSASATASTGA